MIAKYGDAVLPKMTVSSGAVVGAINVLTKRLIGNGDDQDAAVFGYTYVRCSKKIHI